MRIYNYHPETGEYLKSTEARKSPREPGIFLMPAHSTTVEPPQVCQNRCAVWANEEWKIIPDHRGQVYWDTVTGKECKITELSEVPSATWTEQPPGDPEEKWNGETWELPLGIARERKINQIRCEADDAARKLKEGYSSTEISSWDLQAAGARILEQDPGSIVASAHFVKTLAHARDIPTEEMVLKILSKLKPYEEAVAGIIARQRQREQQVKEVLTVEELDSI